MSYFCKCRAVSAFAGITLPLDFCSMKKYSLLDENYYLSFFSWLFSHPLTTIPFLLLKSEAQIDVPATAFIMSFSSTDQSCFSSPNT